MNQKKCPKCGEMNPAEAVMCWACYTPLAGGAVGAGAGGAVAVGAPGVIAHDHQDDKKKAIAPWQMGVVAVGLLALLGVGFKAMSGPSDPDIGTGTTVVQSGGGFERGSGSNQSVAPNVPTNNLSPSTSTTTTQTDGKLPYTMVSAPNGNLEWGVAAIVPAQAGVNPARAVAIADFVRRTMAGNRWKAMHIYVFDDSQSANAFNEFQIPRRADVLGASDCSQLTQLWPHCVVRYEYKDGKASYLMPSRNPTGWWAKTG